MKTYTFTVPAPFVGFKQSSIKIRTRRGRILHISGGDYVAFREKVRTIALEAGYRPIHTTAKAYAMFSLKLFWKGKPRIDWSNVYKSFEDACFLQDRYVIPFEPLMAWDVPDLKDSIAEVTIKRGQGGEMSDCICAEWDGRGWSVCGIPCGVHPPMGKCPECDRKTHLDRLCAAHALCEMCGKRGNPECWNCKHMEPLKKKETP